VRQRKQVVEIFHPAVRKTKRYDRLCARTSLLAVRSDLL
jgi:hypothetical protein